MFFPTHTMNNLENMNTKGDCDHVSIILLSLVLMSLQEEELVYYKAIEGRFP